MNRLTIDNDTQYDLIGNYDSNVEEFANNHKLRNELLNKLGQYEDLEEKNKIDYRKILQCEHGTKVYVFYGGKIYEQIIDDLTWDHFLTNLVPEMHCQFKLFFKEYGTYWALTREELMKGSE